MTVSLGSSRKKGTGTARASLEPVPIFLNRSIQKKTALAGAFLDMGVGASRSSANRPKTWTALVDTGADLTVINPSIVSSLEPQQIGNIGIGGTDGRTIWRNTHEVRVRFGGHAGPNRWYAIEAVEVQPATPDVDLQIGMDLLIKINMTWLGTRRQVLIDH